MDSFPGTYALVLQTAQASNVRVGRLGEMPVQPGFYVYVGSAFGPGGLRGRLSHHLKRQAAPHWHIDYLRRVTDLLEVWMAAGPVKREHEWAQILCLSPGASIPLPRFGASDCRCPAHLVYFADRPEESHLCQLLGGAWLDVDILPGGCGHPPGARLGSQLERGLVIHQEQGLPRLLPADGHIRCF